MPINQCQLLGHSVVGQQEVHHAGELRHGVGQRHEVHPGPQPAAEVVAELALLQHHHRARIR